MIKKLCLVTLLGGFLAGCGYVDLSDMKWPKGDSKMGYSKSQMHHAQPHPAEYQD